MHAVHCHVVVCSGCPRSCNYYSMPSVTMSLLYTAVERSVHNVYVQSAEAMAEHH
jgi:hypothetical protein